MNPMIIQALVRHALTGIAGGMIVKYGIDASAMDAVIGGLSAAAGIGWSIYEKRSDK